MAGEGQGQVPVDEEALDAWLGRCLTDETYRRSVLARLMDNARGLGYADFETLMTLGDIHTHNVR